MQNVRFTQGHIKSLRLLKTMYTLFAGTPV